MRIKTIICALTMLAGLVLSAHGEDEPVHNITFRTYPLGDAYPEKLYYKGSDGEVKPVVVLRNKGMRSPEHHYTGTSPMRLYRMGESAEGAKIPVLVAEVALEQITDQYLLFLAYSRSHPDRLYVQKMRDDWDNFPSSHILLVNASPDTIYIGLGEQKLKLVPGQVSKPYGIPPEGSESIPVGIIKEDANGEYVPLLKNHWRFYGNGRELIVLAPRMDDSTAPLKVYRVSQYKNI